VIKKTGEIMPYSFWEAVAETPWWIYWLLCCLFYFAYSATKPRIIFLKSALITESVLIVLLLLLLASIAPFNILNILLFMALSGMGTVLGWLQFWYSGIKIIKNKVQFYSPGTWSIFIFISVILFLKYYFLGPRFLFGPVIMDQVYAHRFLAASVGLWVGLFIGRASYAFRCMKQGPSIDEKDLPLPCRID
jgi:hypothetical protein